MDATIGGDCLSMSLRISGIAAMSVSAIIFPLTLFVVNTNNMTRFRSTALFSNARRRMLSSVVMVTQPFLPTAGSHTVSSSPRRKCDTCRSTAMSATANASRTALLLQWFSSKKIE